ncbi:MAG TPA: DoxX-like family protein [Pseudomonadales bacterium]|nr:DoxX-like family protein [Pseudomonadales bacterium]
METLSRNQLPARLSLCFLWLFTALTSVLWGRNAGYAVLAQHNIQGATADLCINAGGILDTIIGLWLLTACHLKWCYRFQILVVTVYSILLTIIDASYWLHPFGPITKNIPIVALLFILLQSDKAIRKSL